MGSATELAEAITGQPSEEPEPAFPGVYDAEIKQITGDGVFFVIPEYSPELQFGPAPWPRLPEFTQHAGPEAQTGNTNGHTHAGANHRHRLLLAENAYPPAGTKCVVAFANGDASLPRVLAIYGWPA